MSGGQRLAIARGGMSTIQCGVMAPIVAILIISFTKWMFSALGLTFLSISSHF